ncbi:MAG: hypothetical protein RL684_1659 [Pseudomonadota bacterium]
MRMAWKILWMGTAAILALGVLLFAVVFAVNFYDEPISAEALALRVAPANSVADGDNLYLAMLGADAPDGEDAIASGRARVDAWNARLAAIARDPAPMGRGESLPQQHGSLRFKGKLSFCTLIDAQCWRNAPSHVPELAGLVQDNRVLFDRYLALQRLGGYHDETAADLMASYPLLYFGKEEHYLLLADLARRLQSGTLVARREACSQLLGEIGKWRRVLAGNGNLLSTMVALAYLQRAELLLADLVADPAIPVEQLFLDGLSLPPLWPPGSTPVSRALAAEYRGAVPMWSRMRDPRFSDAQADALDAGGPRWWNRLKGRAETHFLRPNASENLYAAMFRQLIAAADAPPRELQAAQAHYDSWRNTQLRLGGLRPLFNPPGRVLASITSDAYYNRFVLRSWDDAAFQQMVQLGYEIRRQRLASAAIPAFLEAHPELATHPVDGREFLWDPVAHTLSVQVLGDHPAESTSTIPVWQAAK